MASSSHPIDASAASTLDTLLILSRSLTGAKQGGMLADALDLLLGGIGCARGAAYTVASGALELVGERGLPPALRASLERLPLVGTPWFPAQKAAQTRKLVADRNFGAAGDAPLDRTALALSRWQQVVACPITAGREVYGVLVLAWPAAEEPDHHGLAVMEIACNMMAVQMARRAEGHRRGESHADEVRLARLATLGTLASGFAEDVGAQLAEIERRLGEQPLQAVRETTARFLAAIQPSAPERLDLAVLAADALALAAPHLRRRRVQVKLRAAGEHFVVGRRNELCQLFLQLVLDLAGALDDPEEVYSDRSALIPRTFALEVCRRAGHEVANLVDAGDDGTGARASFFEIGARVGDAALDLGVARRIVLAHEGHIELGPAEGGGGVRCSIVLPAAGGEADRHAARPRPAPGVRPRSDRPRPILLWIDEDDLFLEIMVQSLPELDVRIARSAAEGMQMLALGVRPSLVLCNVRLPDRSGQELHAEVVRQIVGLGERFVFIADGVLTPESASYLVASGRPTLMRPINLSQVKALALGEATALHPAAGAAPTLADLHADPRRAPTVPALTAVAPPRPSDHGDRPTPIAPITPITSSAPPAASHSERPPTKREHELGAIARAAADTLRREGPKRGGAVISILRERGLSEPEAQSVIAFALSTGILVRDPPPSTTLRVPDAAQRKTVLVVDDDFDLRQTVREILEDEGYEVETAANGREALDVLQCSNPPRVMVLDLMMPVMDGWQLLDELKRDDALATIPIVVISAGKTGLRAPGVHEFLGKPLDYYKLLSTIERSMMIRVGA